PNANEATTSGYHAVWSRDLYHVATAFLAVGDKASAKRALNFLFERQQKPDGSFPQNSRVDGRPIGTALQMDQVAYPILLAYQIGNVDRFTWLRHIKPAANYIVHDGPVTDQERWEEESGHSPSTLATLLAALAAAAEIAAEQLEQVYADSYISTAKAWQDK